MKVGRIILATILIWIVSTAIMMLTCGWLFSWVYTLEPIIWLDQVTITSTTNMIITNLLGLAFSLIFVLVYATLYKGIPGKGIVKGMLFGIFIWLIGALPGMAIMPFYMTISTIVIVYWLIQALIVKIITGAILGAVYKQ